MDEPTSTERPANDEPSRSGTNPDNQGRVRQTIVLGAEIGRSVTAKLHRDPDEGKGNQTFVLNVDARADEGSQSKSVKTLKHGVDGRTVVFADSSDPSPDGSRPGPIRHSPVAKTISLASPTDPGAPSDSDARDDNPLARTMVLDVGSRLDRDPFEEPADHVPGSPTIVLSNISEPSHHEVVQDASPPAISETIDFVSMNTPKTRSRQTADAESRTTPEVGVDLDASPIPNSGLESLPRRTNYDPSVDHSSGTTGAGKLVDYFSCSSREGVGDERQVDTAHPRRPTGTTTPAEGGSRGQTRLIWQTKRQLGIATSFVLAAAGCAGMSSAVQSYTYACAVLAWLVGTVSVWRYLRSIHALARLTLP
jgi:hypothetical protein